MGKVIVVNETQDDKEILRRTVIADSASGQETGEASDPADSPRNAISNVLNTLRERARTNAEQPENGTTASTRENGRSTEVPDKLVIPAGAGVKIDSDQLRLYDYLPLEKAGVVRVILADEPETVPAARLVVNKTARRIGIKNNAGTTQDKLIIPAFGTRRVLLSNLEDYDYKSWQQLNLIEVKTDEPAPEHDLDWWWYFPMFWAMYGWLAMFFLDEPIERQSWWPDISAWWLWPGGAAALALVTGLIVFFFLSNKGKAIRKVIGQTANLLVLLSLGPVGLPILVVLLFGGVFESFQGLDASLIEGFTPGLLERFIQVTLVILLSALPGLLYFQFERRQVRALRTRFKRDIMLLNPWVHTEDDAEIMYGNTLDEVSVSSGANTRQFTMFAAGRPILMATLLITVGWIFTLWPVGAVSDSVSVATMLAPEQSAVVFAFLGSYFFALNLIFRRYTRGDLTPKAYSHILVRILSAVIVVWAVSMLFSGEESRLVLVLAFGIGIVPETGIALLKDFVRRSERMSGRFPSLSVSNPITELEGISLYDQARLLEEGIDSVETLAHHNLIELMLRSGIPTPRLVDLVDQAILYLHVTGHVGGTSNQDEIKGIDVLRASGVRTATDLLQVVDAMDNRLKRAKRSKNNQAINAAKAERNRFFKLIDPDSRTKPHRLQLALDALEDDEYLEYVKNWRQMGYAKEIVDDPESFYHMPR